MNRLMGYRLFLLIFAITSIANIYPSLAFGSIADVGGTWSLRADGEVKGATNRCGCCPTGGAQPEKCGSDLNDTFAMGDADIHVTQAGTAISASEGDALENIFTLEGNVDGNAVSFIISGNGITPCIGNAVTTYKGTVAGNEISGTFSGYGVCCGSDAVYDYPTWTGTFTVNISNMFVNVGSGRCLTANASRHAKTAITITDCNSIAAQLDGSQIASIVDKSIRFFDDMCMDISGNKVIINPCNEKSSQEWQAQNNVISSISKNKCAGVSNRQQKSGAAIVIGSCDQEMPEQHQLFVPIPRDAKIEQCFGAVGPKCDGVPGLAVADKRDVLGQQKAFVSVGSIAHDNCCLNHPDGLNCSGFEWAIPSDWSRPCMAEWAKAYSDAARVRPQRQWKVKVPFGPYSVNHLGDNLTSSTLPERSVNLPTEKGPYESKSLKETVSTRRLAAPKGTPIDPLDKDFCQSGEVERHRTSKYYICK